MLLEHPKTKADIQGKCFPGSLVLIHMLILILPVSFFLYSTFTIIFFLMCRKATPILIYLALCTMLSSWKKNP